MGAEMTLYAVIFYLLGIVILTATGLAVTRRQPIHAVSYLIVAFLGTAGLFFLLPGTALSRLRGHHLRRGDHGPRPVCDHVASAVSPGAPDGCLSGGLPCFWESSFSLSPSRRSSKIPAAGTSSRALSPSPATLVVSSSTDTGWLLRSSPFCSSLPWWLSFT